MAPTHVYIGPDATYPQLVYAEGVAPFTCRSGVTAVDFGEHEPPADGHWQPLAGKKRPDATLPDNHPDVVAAANTEAQAAAEAAIPDDEPPAEDEPTPDAAAPTADATSTAGS